MKLRDTGKLTVLVVGGAGYIGSHMVGELLRSGFRVVTLDDLSRGHRDMVLGGEFIKGDFGDAALLDALFADHRIDAVMHFAALALVGESVENPLAYYHSNISKTVELLGAMVRHDVRRLIFSSTAAVYGEPAGVPISEDHPCNPTNPYGATKIAVERMLRDCDAAYGVKYVSLRYFNAAGADASGGIGERHDPETHLIPLVLKAAAGELLNIRVFGTDYPTPDGTCVRDYVHVSDLAAAHLLALELLLSRGESAVYNLGNCKGHSVRDVIETARQVTGKAIRVVEGGRRQGDPAILVARSDKIRKELGWKPRFEDLKTIIQTAWAWHQEEAKRK